MQEQNGNVMSPECFRHFMEVTKLTWNPSEKDAEPLPLSYEDHLNMNRADLIRIFLVNAAGNISAQQKFIREYHLTKEEYKEFLDWDENRDRNDVEEWLRDKPLENFRLYRADWQPFFKILNHRKYRMNQEIHNNHEAVLSWLANTPRRLNLLPKVNCPNRRTQRAWICRCDVCRMQGVGIITMMVITALESIGTPIVWVWPDICRDLLESDIEGTLTFEDIKIPDLAGIYMLPRGMFPPAKNDEATKYDVTIYPRAIVWQHDVDRHKLNILVMYQSDSDDLEKVYSGPAMMSINTQCSISDSITAIKEQGMAEQEIEMVKLLVNFFAAQTEQKYFEAAGIKFRQQSVKEKKQSVRVGEWSPYKLGQHYHSTANEDHLRSGGTKRLHRVRGHFRNQPYGPKNSLRKVKWILPHWSGGNKVDTVEES